MWSLFWQALVELPVAARNARRDRSLPIAHGQVLVMAASPASDDEAWAQLATRLAETRFVRGARAGKVTVLGASGDQPIELWSPEFDERIEGGGIRPVDDDPSAAQRNQRFVPRSTRPTVGLPSLNVISCRPGWERHLARRLRRALLRANRAPGSAPGSVPFVTAVPLACPERSEAWEEITNVEVNTYSAPGVGEWRPRIGIVDTDINETLIASKWPATRVLWRGCVVDGGNLVPLRIDNNPALRSPARHGTAVASIIAASVVADIDHVSYRTDPHPLRDPRTFDTLDDLPATFIVHALAELSSCDVINLSLTVDQRVNDVAAQFEGVLEALIKTLVDTGVLVVAATGRTTIRPTRQPGGDYVSRASRVAGFPARSQFVVAASSTSPGDALEGILGSHWTIEVNGLCDTDSGPFVHSSAATAVASGLAALQMAKYRPATRRSPATIFRLPYLDDGALPLGHRLITSI